MIAGYGGQIVFLFFLEVEWADVCMRFIKYRFFCNRTWSIVYYVVQDID